MDKQLSYKGQMEADTGFYFAPYIPGMSKEQIAEVNERLKSSQPTEIQQRIMDIVKNPK